MTRYVSVPIETTKSGKFCGKKCPWHGSFHGTCLVASSIFEAQYYLDGRKGRWLRSAYCRAHETKDRPKEEKS